MLTKRGRSGDQYRSGHGLTENSTNQYVEPGDLQVPDRQALVDQRRMLIENCPRHDAGAEVGREQIEVVVISERHLTQSGGKLTDVGMGFPRHDHETQLE